MPRSAFFAFLTLSPRPGLGVWLGLNKRSLCFSLCHLLAPLQTSPHARDPRTVDVLDFFASSPYPHPNHDLNPNPRSVSAPDFCAAGRGHKVVRTPLRAAGEGGDGLGVGDGEGAEEEAELARLLAELEGLAGG